MKKPRIAGLFVFEHPAVSVPVLHDVGDDRHQQDRDDVRDLDERVDGRTGGVFIRITDGVARHGGLVGIAALAAEIPFLDELLGVVPRTAAGRHGPCGSAAHRRRVRCTQ